MTLKNKLVKINQTLQVHMYDNGYMLEASGSNHTGDYVTARVLCLSIEDVFSLVKEASEIERID